MPYPNQIQRLIEHFSRLPGIGPRQAARLAYALVDRDAAFVQAFAAALSNLKEQIGVCSLCFRVMEKTSSSLCEICRSSSRDSKKIMVVEKESDVQIFESSNVFNGLYHLTGGTIDPLDKSPGDKLHLRDLFERIKSHPEREQVEVIVATSNTLEGNQTANYIERILEPMKVVLTRLGRGLSTGAEIEYADPLTLENALKNRK